MKVLWNVLVVTVTEQILLDRKVVAEDREGAILTAGVGDALKAAGLKPSEVTVLTINLGSVKVKPEPQKVQIVEQAS